MRKLKKIFLSGILLGILIIFSVNTVSAVCCERTIVVNGVGGGTCVDVADDQYCDDEYRIDKTTACASTQYCNPTGTCVNNKDGTCMISSSAACNPDLGGFWREENYITEPGAIPECQIGCCVTGEGTVLEPRTTCTARAATKGITPDFRESITDLDECLSIAGPSTKGACVFQTDVGKDCDIYTHEECLALGRKPHPGLLCSANILGTICTMTEETKCDDEKGHEVYFRDNCGNTANVYNSALIEDVDYWTYMKDPASSEICGFGSANINNKTCGNCYYGDAGSTCGSARGTGVEPEFGDFICRDLSCDYNGVTKPHGSAWCSAPLSSFEQTNPGDLSYRLSCYNGEVERTLCGNRREELCKETILVSETTLPDGSVVVTETGLGDANCDMNFWQLCTAQENSNDCLNPAMDCTIKTGISKKNQTTGEDILFLDYTYTYDTDGNIASESSELIKAICVARYPPGFNFWETETTIEGEETEVTPAYVCSAGSISALAGYSTNIVAKWNAKEYSCFAKCIEDYSLKERQKICFALCPDSEAFIDMPRSGELGVGYVNLSSTWTEEREGLCISLGDCGVKANYLGRDSYYSWKELFIGDNITKASIFEADNYQ